MRDEHVYRYPQNNDMIAQVYTVTELAHNIAPLSTSYASHFFTHMAASASGGGGNVDVGGIRNREICRGGFPLELAIPDLQKSPWGNLHNLYPCRFLTLFS